MLKLREVQTFSPVIHDVVGDLLRRIEFLRSGSQDGVTVPDIASELYRFGFEGDNCLCSGNARRDPGKFPRFFGNCFLLAGISAILFETRLGCLEEKINPKAERFIRGVNDMLSLSDFAYLVPRWTRGFIPVWSRFVQAWDDISDIGVQRKAAIFDFGCAR